MKTSEIILYKNTPFIDFQNTILFSSNKERDDYFDSRFDFISYDIGRFNFIRDKSTLRVPTSYFSIQGVNYCRFVSQMEGNQVYYAFVVSYKYLNDATTELNLVIDPIMSFCQGDTLSKFSNLSITRKHMKRSEYNQRLSELRCNDDVIKTHTKAYTHTEKMLFKDLSVLMQVSCSLTADFGNVDNPKIRTSSGLTFDKITSPVNLYVVPKANFKDFMSKMSKFAWITQNIRSVSLVPTILIEKNLTKQTPTSIDFNELYALDDNGNTAFTILDNELVKISKTNDELCSIFGLNKNEDKHLLRNEYTTTEVYTFNGEQLYIDNGLLSETYGLKFESTTVMGFHNEIAIYVKNYKSSDSTEGSFLNDAIFIRNFDDVPIMIDNYNLALSKSANQRQLAESKLVTNQVASITDGDVSAKDKFFTGASLISNITPMGLFGRFTDEYNFYQQQQAEFKDMALDTNNVTSSSNNNSLAIARNFFGLTVKHAQPNAKEWEKIKKYYKLFGYLVNDENSKIDNRCMTICDYVKFKGNYFINGVDVALNEMLKAQFENGVRFWHYNGVRDPMQQNILENKMR